jgi:hypothetical protein
MSNAPDGRGLAEDEFDDDEIDWDDETAPEDGLSPIEGLPAEGEDLFAADNDDEEDD